MQGLGQLDPPHQVQPSLLVHSQQSRALSEHCSRYLHLHNSRTFKEYLSWEIEIFQGAKINFPGGSLYKLTVSADSLLD